MKKKIIGGYIVLALVLFFSINSNAYAATNNFKLKCNKYQAKIGKKIQCKVYNTKTGKSKKAKWSTSNPATISVNQNGVVTIKGGPATATISAQWTLNDKTTRSDTVSIKSIKSINSGTTYSLKITCPKTEITVGERLNCDATGNTGYRTWKSSNSSVAKVAEYGMVTGMSAGKVKITASANGKKASITIKVKNEKQNFDINGPDTIKKKTSEIYKVSSSVTSKCRYTSTNVNVLRFKIGTQGYAASYKGYNAVVYGNKKGKAKIKVTCGTTTKSKVITVVANPNLISSNESVSIKESSNSNIIRSADLKDIKCSKNSLKVGETIKCYVPLSGWDQVQSDNSAYKYADIKPFDDYDNNHNHQKGFKVTGKKAGSFRVDYKKDGKVKYTISIRVD